MAVNLIEGYIYRIIAAQGLAAEVPALILGEIGYDTDTKTLRVGDATTIPPRIMTDKSTGEFNFESVTKIRVSSLDVVSGGKVDGVDISTMNVSNGFVMRHGNGLLHNRIFVSGNGTISIVNADGVSGDPDLRVSDALIALLTPPRFWVSPTAPATPRVGDFWNDTDGVDNVSGNADDGVVYIRNSNGVSEYWTQISNEYQNATETVVGLTRYATTPEALARTLNSVALTPKSLTALIGAGNDFRPVLNATLTAPPGSPATRDAYLVPFGASGAWSTHVGKVATWDGTAWVYETLRLGAIVIDSNKPVTSPTHALRQKVLYGWTTIAATSTDYGFTRFASLTETEAGDVTNVAINPVVLFNKKNPFFISSGSSNQSIPNNVDTKVTNLNAPTASYFNTGSSFGSSAFTCGTKDAGAWLFVAYGALALATAASGGNDYRGSIAKNGATGPFATTTLLDSTTYGVVVMNPYILVAGDIIDFHVLQSSGTNRNLGATQFFGMRLGAAS